MTTKEVADLLGVSVPTVHRLVQRGDLTAAAKAPGRRGAFLFDPQEVKRYAAERSR